MLTVGRARLKAGTDVVVGVVETHGRSETGTLVEGFEVMARRCVAYHGTMLDEMDLDALLLRRPALALVDELAHTNAPGSRHPKRYQDVEELLDAGIDVYTTLNIQHVESLNDVVAQITRIRVRETVPDGVLDRADDIEVVDLNPDDLIQRLRDGKVYVKGNAERALKHYFSRGNLTALRELALRRTADRVDDELLSHMRANAIAGPWGAGERVLVCVSEDPRSAGLVRHAKRLADRLHAPWTAITVEGPSQPVTRRGRPRPHRRHPPPRRPPRRRCRHASGRSTRRRRHPCLRPFDQRQPHHPRQGRPVEACSSSSTARWCTTSSGTRATISIHVITGEAIEGRSGPPEDGRHGSGQACPSVTSALRRRPVLATAVGPRARARFVEPYLGVENADLILLTAIVAVAVRFGLGPSLAVGAVIASLSYNFFFLPPVYTLTIADPTNVAAFLLFTVVAVAVSNLASQVPPRGQWSRMAVPVQRSDSTVSAASSPAAEPSTTCSGPPRPRSPPCSRSASCSCCPRTTSSRWRAGFPPEDRLDAADFGAAKWAFDNERPAGRGADTLPGARRLFLPMRTGRGIVGVIGLDADRIGPILTPEERRLFDTLADMAALAIERVRLVQDLDRAERAAETDRLRQALLTSISHDLRTPLASVLGAATTLRDLDGALAHEAKADLLTTVIAESERLNRFIVNLLDMTRLEAGAVAANLTLQDVAEIVDTALRRLGPILAGHRVVLDLPAGLPALRLDPVLFEQVLVNLLDNAAKYAPEESTVTVRGSAEGGWVRLAVLDEGDGLPEADVERVFDKFYRVRKGDSVRAGTGLGLAIARGFVEAMGGTLTAGNRRDRLGAIFTIVLPVPGHSRADVAA